MGSAGRTSFKRPSTSSSFFSVTTPSHQRATPDPSQDSEKMFCHHCDDSLAGHRYVLRDDHPYCIKCYESVFANNCDECGKVIGIDSKDLSYKEKHCTRAASSAASAGPAWLTSSSVLRLTGSTVAPAM